MKNDINLHLIMAPMGKQRPRLSTKGRFARAYTPEKTSKWTKAARRAIRAQYTGQPIEKNVPLQVRVLAVHKRPQRLLRKADPVGRIWKTTKPDIDNIAKIIYDSGNQLLWADDAQIVRTINEDCYAAKDEEPSIYIYISVLNDYSSCAE
jgi:Holliday junction resolvase RusA-like endonuclease